MKNSFGPYKVVKGEYLLQFRATGTFKEYYYVIHEDSHQIFGKYHESKSFLAYTLAEGLYATDLKKMDKEMHQLLLKSDDV